jgi:hypothetical protein
MADIRLNWRLQEVFDDRTRNRVIVGGRRIGKTEFLLAEALTGLMVPNTATWYVAPTYKQAKTIFWQRIKNILPGNFLKRAPHETDLRLETRINSSLELRGADNPDSLRGVALDKLLLDELDFWTAPEMAYGAVLRPMLVTTRGSLVAAGSPNGFRLLKDFYDRGQRGEHGWASWLMKTSQFVAPAGHIDPEEYEASKRDMDSRTFNQEWEAEFANAIGRACYAWSEGNVRRVQYDPMQDIVVSMDFNVAPAAAIFAHVEGNQVVHQFGELNIRDAWTQVVADEIVRKFANHQAKISFFGDPSGTKRKSSSKQTDWQIVEAAARLKWGNRASFHYDRGIISERAKINALNARICNSLGDRRYYVDPSCKESIKDFEQVTCAPDGSVEKRDLSRTHWFDAAGYLCEKKWPIAGVPDLQGFSAFN